MCLNFKSSLFITGILCILPIKRQIVVITIVIIEIVIKIVSLAMILKSNNPMCSVIFQNVGDPTKECKDIREPNKVKSV